MTCFRTITEWIVCVTLCSLLNFSTDLSQLQVHLLKKQLKREKHHRDGMFFAKFGVQVIGSRWLIQRALHLSIKVCSIQVGSKQVLSRKKGFWKGKEIISKRESKPSRADDFVSIFYCLLLATKNKNQLFMYWDEQFFNLRKWKFKARNSFIFCSPYENNVTRGKI